MYRQLCAVQETRERELRDMGASLRTDDCQRVNRARFALLTQSCASNKYVELLQTFHRADYVPNKARTEIFFIGLTRVQARRFRMRGEVVEVYPSY